ncbi:MAG TPA: hypothetical protein VN706_15880 [Gemmatimonadaceae bacterium]|nr:hypothetical protein [Gemmatimonadaceae bacterium]
MPIFGGIAVNEDVTPALSGAEWAGVLANRAQLDDIREQLLDTPFSAHAVAALLLYEEPFGFSAQDVDDEVQVADYCRAMARQLETTGQTETAETFRMLGERHTIRAAKIASLLPPKVASPDAVEP